MEWSHLWRWHILWGSILCGSARPGEVGCFDDVSGTIVAPRSGRATRNASSWTMAGGASTFTWLIAWRSGCKMLRPREESIRYKIKMFTVFWCILHHDIMTYLYWRALHFCARMIASEGNFLNFDEPRPSPMLAPEELLGSKEWLEAICRTNRWWKLMKIDETWSRKQLWSRSCLYLRPDDPPGALSDTFVQSRSVQFSFTTRHISNRRASQFHLVSWWRCRGTKKRKKRMRPKKRRTCRTC